MQYKTLIFIICVVFPYFINAQEYRLSFEQSGNLSIYNFSSDFPYSIPGRDLKPRLGFESELRFSFTPKKKISFYTGVGFKKYNYTSGMIETRFSDQILPRNGFEPPSLENAPTSFKINHSYNYLSIPLGVQFSPNQRIFFAIGIDVLRKLSVYSYTKYYYSISGRTENNFDKKVFDNQGYANWVLSTHAEVGYVIPIFKYDITWKAIFEYAATNFFAKEHPKLHLHPYTFNLGASFPLVINNK